MSLVARETQSSACAIFGCYGAGHVAQAWCAFLPICPSAITWIDARAELLPAPIAGECSRAIHIVVAHRGSVDTRLAPRGILVMTHDHALDYEICRSHPSAQ